MTETQKELARHALGLPNRKNESYRNHFCTGPGSLDFDHWEDLVTKGLADKRTDGPWGGDHMFYLTLGRGGDDSGGVGVEMTEADLDREWSQEELRAHLGVTAEEFRGEMIPQCVKYVSQEPPTEDEIAWAKRIIAAHPEWSKP
jgi:hypothetical protein